MRSADERDLASAVRLILNNYRDGMRAPESFDQVCQSLMADGLSYWTAVLTATEATAQVLEMVNKAQGETGRRDAEIMIVDLGLENMPDINLVREDG